MADTADAAASSSAAASAASAAAASAAASASAAADRSPTRLLAGLLVLLAVDFIWVASSELTKYIFETAAFDKPFFTTYAKTALFMLYLPGFLLIKSWRDQCRCGRGGGGGGTGGGQATAQRRRRRRRDYQLVAGGEEEEDEDEDNDDETEEEQQQPPSSAPSTAENGGSNGGGAGTRLSHPIFLPINYTESGKSSDTEASDLERSSRAASSGDVAADAAAAAEASRKVRFSRVAEVRQMSARDALHANLSRLSYNATIRAQAALRRAASRLTVREVALLALTFCLLWFLANCSYQEGLSRADPGVVNVLSSSSCLWTLILAAIFPSADGATDRLTLSKLVTVAFSVTGVALVSYADLERESGGGGVGRLPTGAIWALASAIFYSAYIVLIRRKCDHEDKLDVPMFFGFVGLFNTLLLWPGFFILHYTGAETFQLPGSKESLMLLLNGLVGTVLSELLWLWGCFLTSSLIATLALSLTIPLTMFAEVFLSRQSYGALFYAGSVPIFVSFFLITLLTHWDDWDPLVDLLKWIYKGLRGLCNPAANNSYVFDRQERESLISQEQSSQVNGESESIG